jgi:hypothetical protein
MQSWIGKTVSEVLAACGTPYAEVTFVDEPPGKLRAVEFLCRAADPPARVVLEFDYSSELFSDRRQWPEALVGPRIVTAVRPHGPSPASF